MKNVLKIWLKPNELTPEHDFIAVVSPMGSLNQAALVDAIMQEGIELKRETVNDVVTRYNRNAAKYAAAGWNVDTGLVYLRPIVTGNFTTNTYDPAKNSIYISANQGKELRAEVANTDVHILGEHPDVINILQVTNMAAKAADGTIQRGRNVQVDGSRIKVAGDDAAVGVYLIDANGVAAKFDSTDIVINEPSRLILLVPDSLPVGQYYLKVITQFTTNAKKLLRAPRETVFHQELTVI
jgi:hypothetical protein